MTTTKIDKQTNQQVGPFTELGQTGLAHYAGEVKEEFLWQLDARNGLRVWIEMRDNDPIVGAVLYAIDMLIRRTPWIVEPFSDEQQDIANATFIEEVQEDMSHSWTDFISEVMTMLPFGWSYFEHVFKRRRGMGRRDAGEQSRFDDGRIGIRKLAIRSQDSFNRWMFDESGGIDGLVQQPAPTFQRIEIPIQKSLLFRTAVRKGNPEGRSVLRNAYRPWFLKKRIEDIEAIGVARDLTGIPVGFVPPQILNANANPTDTAIRDQLMKIVKNLHQDKQAGLLWPSLFDDNGNKIYDIQLLRSGGEAKHDTTAILQRYDSHIAMTVLADVILMGHQDVGSFALSSSKTNLFATSLGAYLDDIENVLNRHLIPRLFRLNGLPMDRLPMWKHGDVESVDLNELGEFISKLAGAGAPLFPDVELENHIREQAGLPVRPADEEDDMGGPQPRQPEPEEVPEDEGMEPEEQDEGA